MKYAIWFVRLVFVAWMLPAGLNHFIPLFPQPLGNMPLSRELFAALDASHLFDLVKAVELIAALCLLTGFYVPLGLLLCMPVSFCVWYWDTPLQGWGSVSSIYGWAVLLCNLALCLAYLPSYRAMLVPRAAPDTWPDRKALVLAARLVFGGWMLLSGVNFFAHVHPMPAGHEPLAVQLMSALVHSQLLDVAMGIQLVAGALILAGVFVPLALSMVMPVCVCAAFWAVILEHEPLGALLALVAVALNGLLMLAYLDHYKGVLDRRAVALGEGNAPYEALFVNAAGRTARAPFLAALVPPRGGGDLLPLSGLRPARHVGDAGDAVPGHRDPRPAAARHGLDRLAAAGAGGSRRRCHLAAHVPSRPCSGAPGGADRARRLRRRHALGPDRDESGRVQSLRRADCLTIISASWAAART